MNPQLNSFRTLIVDDYPEIQSLISFVVETNFAAQVTVASSAKEAIDILNKDSKFDLIISDINMPGGNGDKIFHFLKEKSLQIPMIFASSDSLDQYPDVKAASWVTHIFKPFLEEDLAKLIEAVMKKTPGVSQQYIPVRLALLRRLKNISVPLFVKINSDKFVKITPDVSVFLEEDEKKYEARGLTHLYIESIFAEQFIMNFSKDAQSNEAWETLSLEDSKEQINMNVELLRNISTKLGWNEQLIGVAQQNLNRALHLAKKHPQLARILDQFHKIEKYSFADHCTLLVMLTSGLANATGIGDEGTLRRLTFAALLHDMSLTDEQYRSKKIYIKKIEQKELLSSREVRDILTHTARSADIVKNWKFCPTGVDVIISNHHEKPDGTGFPLGRDVTQIDYMSALFILAEDFVDFCLEHIGGCDPAVFIRLNKQKYSQPPFYPFFEVLEKSVS